MTPGNYLNKINIKQLLKLVFYSSTIAIVILTTSTIIIEKLSLDSQKELMNHVVKIGTITNNLNNSITALIRRTTNIALSENIDELKSASKRKELEQELTDNLITLKELLKKTTDDTTLINDFKNIYEKFLAADNEYLKKQETLIILNERLYGKNLALEIYVNNIIGAVEAAAGKIKLKASRARHARETRDIGDNKIPITNSFLENESLSEQQQRVENASHQVQLSAIQIVRLSRKLLQTSNRDALVSIRDNEIAQEISQIRISLNILRAYLKEFPKLMKDVASVHNSTTFLINILLEDRLSIYNLRTQYLDLKHNLDSHLRNEVYKNTDAMVKITDDLGKHVNNIIDLNKREREISLKINYLIILLLSIFVIIFITSSLRTLKYRIDKPLQLINGAVNDLSNGQLASRLNSNNFAKDEFWSVANSFNQFAERNEQLINELSSTHDALLENQQRLNAILENALVGIAHLKDRYFISVNQRFEEMFGYDRENLEGLRTEILFPSKNDFETVGEQAYPDFREGNTYRSEWKLRHNNGNEFWCAISAKSIEDGKPESGTIWLYEDISERKKTEEQLIALANYDNLTGLPNRALFMDRLLNHIDLAKRNDQMIAVMYIDLDRFKQINDTLGHEAGDKLLIEVAKRLNSSVRNSDTVARIGGDEFTIIMIGLRNKEIPARTASKIIKLLEKPVLIDNQEVETSPSIGISMYPADGNNITELIRNADSAMYQAKNHGRNNFQFYSANINAESLNN
jgi:diguanylate cyclase (GGDEF)-like protein/PAS domain S-box-containing protein